MAVFGETRAPMQKKVPTPVMVIAVLHLIFAGCGVLGSAMALSGLAEKFQEMQTAGDPKQAKLQKALQEKLEAKVPNMKTFERVNTGIDAGLSILLLVCGIGLLKLQQWARLGSIAYAIIDIGYKIYIVVFLIMFLQGPIDDTITEVMRDQNINDPAFRQIMQFALIGGISGAAFCGMIYPVAVLIVMLLPSVSKAFRQLPEDRPGYGVDDDLGGFEREKFE